MSRLIYGYALDECRTKDLEAEAQEFGWTNLYWVGPSKDTLGEWRLYGEPPVETGDKGPKREPIGSVKIPCDEKVWRNMELQAKADGWSDMMWASDLEVGTLYGRRAVLVKTESTRPAWSPRPAWLNEGEQVIFTARKGKYSAEILQSRHDAVGKAVYAGWVELRWVDDRDSGLNHLVGRKTPPADRITAAIERWVDDRDSGLNHLKKPPPTRMTTPDARWTDEAGSAYVHIDLTRPEGTKPLPAPSFDATSSTYVIDFGKGVGDSDGLPRIRSELGGLMGPGYQATGYEPPPRRQVLLDDPTGDDIAGDAP